MMLPLISQLLIACLVLQPAASFVSNRDRIGGKRTIRIITTTITRIKTSIKTTTVRTTTQCWGKYGRNTPKRTRIDTDDILSYERSLVTDRGYSYILGSDESGRGSIAGPVVTATCCILTLTDDNGIVIDPSLLPTVGLLPPPDGSKNSKNKLIRDSKQLSPEDRERIYETIVNNPQVYAFSVAVRSNTEIDETNNILSTTMEAFQESIENMTQNTLFPRIYSAQQGGKSDANAGADADIPVTIPDDWEDCGCYGIVDGKKAPKLSTSPSFPCRPMVKADQQVYTVALASIIAKVTLDRMTEEWHELYPQYGFDQNKGYATRDHIEAIHEHGPCPLHRMTFKSLKGR
mmetsp:Transcript_8135/g.24061  ORF Transcript_8135/g.24061 Transcript_8135/m.24061 type:complete len:347 (+) Transcript_8135:149-1189(+)